MACLAPLGGRDSSEHGIPEERWSISKPPGKQRLWYQAKEEEEENKARWADRPWLSVLRMVFCEHTFWHGKLGKHENGVSHDWSTVLFFYKVTFQCLIPCLSLLRGACQMFEAVWKSTIYISIDLTGLNYYILSLILNPKLCWRMLSDLYAYHTGCGLKTFQRR